MRVLRIARVWASAAVSLLPAFGVRGQEPPRLPLHLKETLVVQGEAAAPITVPVKCDTEGNIYLRRWLPPNPLASPVVKISSEGKRGPSFAFASVPGLEKAQLHDFAVGLRGEVYLLMQKSIEEVLIVKFNVEGEYGWSTILDRPFSPAQLAVFPSGEFLLSGTKPSNAREKEGTRPGEPFTAIFDRSGRLLQNLTLGGDAQPEKKQAATEQADDPNPAVSLGVAVPADDGNIYLMRRTSPALFFVLSPGGEVLRRMVVPAPSPKFRPITAKVAGGKLVVQFEEDEPAGGIAEQLLAVADAQTAEVSVVYVSGPGIGGAFACYTPNAFTFLGVQQGRLTLQHTVPH